MDINEKMKEYLKVREEADRLHDLSENLKKEIDIEMEDDLLLIEGVGKFKRTPPGVTKRFDKNLAEQKMPPEDFVQCYKEVPRKGFVTIMSWPSHLNQQKILKR